MQNFKFSNSLVMKFMGQRMNFTTGQIYIIMFQIRNLPSLYPVTDVHIAKFYLKYI